MSSLISYDIDDGWNEVMDAALANGFENCIQSKNGWKKLPDTTLIYRADDTAAVRRLFYGTVIPAAVAAAGSPINVEKFICVAFNTFSVRSNVACEGAQRS